MIDFKTDEEIRKWLDKNYPVENLTLEDVEEKFIENFGVAAFEEFKFTTKLDNEADKLCTFLGIPYIPFFFEEMYEDGRYYPEIDAFSINKNYLFNWDESLKSLIHEIKHAHQRYCVAHKNKKNLKFASQKLLDIWEKELAVDPQSIPEDEMLARVVEADAYAFTKFILRNWYHKDYHHQDGYYDAFLEQYMFDNFVGK